MVSVSFNLGPSVHCEGRWEYEACYKLQHCFFTFCFLFCSAQPTFRCCSLLALPSLYLIRGCKLHPEAIVCPLY